MYAAHRTGKEGDVDDEGSAAKKKQKKITENAATFPLSGCYFIPHFTVIIVL